MKDSKQIIDWLLEGDVAIRYQAHRDLLDSPAAKTTAYQRRIATEGWGARFLAARTPDGHWGRGFYQPKWISTHYTLLDLKHTGLPETNPETRESIEMLFLEAARARRAPVPISAFPSSDVCVNGMVLSYASYFHAKPRYLAGLVDRLLDARMNDGGWNCADTRGATHSSLHTTLSVLEGFLEYGKAGGMHRVQDMNKAISSGEEFILAHRLFQSHRTGETIDKKMLMLSFPSRWRYDILRCLDYFRSARRGLDPRMEPALSVLTGKQRKDGTWPLQAKHPGQVHFDMEECGKPSRWNTLRAIRVLDWFGNTVYPD